MRRDIYSGDRHYLQNKEVERLENMILLISIILLLINFMPPIVKNKWWGKRKKDLAKTINQVNPAVPINSKPLKTYKDKRNCVRVPVNNIYCIAKFDHFGDPKLQKLNDKTIDGHIEDISLSGLKFVSNFELPVRSDIRTTISFHLGEFVFSIKGKIIRRQDHLNFENVIYGVEFTEMLPNQQKQLNKWINDHIKFDYAGS